MGTEKMLFRLEQPHGSGDVYIAWQNGAGNYLATTGVDSAVNIFDRYGNTLETIRLSSLCAGFAWDSDGDVLGVISQSPQLVLWDANTKKKQNVDIGLKDILSCILWAKSIPVLAVGTAKGNVSIYNHTTSKRIPIIAKHTKKITCGGWNKDNLLALGSEDKTISISNMEGDTLRVISLRAEPSDVQFSEMKLDERAGGENTVSMIVGKRTLYLYHLMDPENPIELAFQQHYGSIVAYKWFGDGYILIGFSGGYFIAISTHIKEVGQELFQVRNHKINLSDIALCVAAGKVASAGDNTVKIHDTSNLQETLSVLTLNQEIGIDRVAWSTDGQLLGVCTRNGSVVVYVADMPTLMAVCGPRIAIQSNLVEISLYKYTGDKTKPLSLALEIEPQVIAVGPFHFASGMNNRIWFYDLLQLERNNYESSSRLVSTRQYLGHVHSIKLNAEYVSVMYDGKIQLHMIETAEAENEERESIIFPDSNSQNATITSHLLTNEFLIYTTDSGQIIYFSLEEWSVANQYRHPVGIQSIYADHAGTRLVFFDVKTLGFLYNAVNNETLQIPDLPNKICGVTWDSNFNNRNCFVIFDEHLISTYLYVMTSVYGSSIQKIGVTTLASKQTPLIMFAGDVISATAGGQLTQIRLITHDVNQLSTTDKDRSQLENNFNKQLDLHRFANALNSATLLGSKELWKKLARKAIVNLEIDLAIRVFKQLEDVAMVQSLEDLSDVEDQKLLSGYVAMYLGDYDQAQICFLKSSNPTVALDMRRDLLQWDQALQLAKKMAPDQIPHISKEYAQQLEFTGNYSEAYIHYEKGLQSELDNPDHILTCKCGIARTSIRTGNFKHGIAIATEMNIKQLYRECADLLDSKKQLVDAAIFYENAGQYDRAAIIYIKLKNWSKVAILLPHVSSNKIHIQYAKAKETEGKYQEAAEAYYNAKDFDSVIRLQLDYLNNPEVAIDLVQETKSIEGAKLIARFFQRLNDIPTAIRFLVLSKCHDEAFELARKHAKLQLYGEILLNSLDPDEIKPEYFNSLALYFEQERNNLYAGKYWFHAKEYTKAMKLLLRVAKSNSEENEALSSAIDVVASSNDESLANQLIEYLLGEVDGVPKDPKYLFRLYMARKQFREASKSANIIANEEQINGNYRNAHDVLFGMYQELKHNGIKVSQEMYTSLMLLHSYILVRLHVKRSDHLKGARMLIRVANNISKFPSHIVPILTSAVIECHRAGLKQAAHRYATLLMKPEHRKKIDPKYAKKIEAVVRKPPKTTKDGDGIDDPLEEFTPCPFCNNELVESEVNCNVCKNHIPFCIATGRHITSTDLTACPECDFPAILSEFVKILETEDTCPMCNEKVDTRRLQNIADFKTYLNYE